MQLPIITNSNSLILDSISTKAGIVKEKEGKEKAESMKGNWNVKALDVNTLISQLSGGNQQKVALGRWVQTTPKILILDSPTVGVDIASKAEIYEKIQAFAKSGAGVIMISDEIPELLTNCSRIAVFSHGQIVKMFDEQALQSEMIRIDIQEAITKVYATENENGGKNE